MVWQVIVNLQNLSQILMWQGLVNLTNIGVAAAIPAILVPTALLFFWWTWACFTWAQLTFLLLFSCQCNWVCIWNSWYALVNLRQFLTRPSLRSLVQGIGRKGKSDDQIYNFFSLKITAFRRQRDCYSKSVAKASQWAFGWG